MKPLFTIHAGEFLVGCEIERKFPRVNVWIPSRDTGIDLLISNSANTATVSLQVKFSRDYLVTNMQGEAFVDRLRACGWWTPTRQQIEESRAQYWVFVLVGSSNRSTDFIIIKPKELLERLNKLHGKTAKKIHNYFWVTKQDKCYDTRGLTREDRCRVANGEFDDKVRDFSSYLNNWSPLAALNV